MATIPQLLAAIPYGKSNAIHAQALAQQLGLPVGGNEVETRQLIREAISQGHIILSIPAIGYWRSNDRQEVLEYINELKKLSNVYVDMDEHYKLYVSKVKTK